MDDMGFIFYPRDDPQSIGYSRLDVTLRSRPTEKHFDPDRSGRGIYTGITRVYTLSRELRVRVFIGAGFISPG
jgi:hypothetical protein